MRYWDTESGSCGMNNKESVSSGVEDGRRERSADEKRSELGSSRGASKTHPRLPAHTMQKPKWNKKGRKE
jgi:hypothetical protein